MKKKNIYTFFNIQSLIPFPPDQDRISVLKKICNENTIPKQFRKGWAEVNQFRALVIAYLDLGIEDGFQ